jgi:site-specific recombinase XerD
VATTAQRQRSVRVGDVGDLIPSWRRSLDAEGKSHRTIQSYEEAGTQFAAFLREMGMPTSAASIRREHVESWLVHLRELGRSSKTCANRYRSLQQLFRWVEDEGEIERSPMAKMRPPKIEEKPVDVFTDDELRRLFDTCKTNSFDDRRDTALLRLLVSTGARVGELAGLRVDDVDLDAKQAFVLGKGQRHRVLPLTPKTVRALDRYLRTRNIHAYSAEPWLWLGKRGRMQESGIQQRLKTLGMQAGVDRVHPHRFRHTYAHNWLAGGGSESDLMRLAGWRSREMLNRYGASAADERAREAHGRLRPGEAI